jgi:hypothetical protein
VLRVSEVEMLFPTFTIWGQPVKVQDPVAQGRVVLLSDEADLLYKLTKYLVLYSHFNLSVLLNG